MVPARSKPRVLGYLRAWDSDVGAGSVFGRGSQEARVREGHPGRESQQKDGCRSKVATAGNGALVPI